MKRRVVLKSILGIVIFPLSKLWNLNNIIWITLHPIKPIKFIQEEIDFVRNFKWTISYSPMRFTQEDVDFMHRIRFRYKN